MTLAIALNYGSQQEIARAAAKAAAKGAITAETIAAELDTADLPPLDLLIRTSGKCACRTSCSGRRPMPRWCLRPCSGLISPRSFARGRWPVRGAGAAFGGR
jgi:hypothetical protein